MIHHSPSSLVSQEMGTFEEDGLELLAAVECRYDLNFHDGQSNNMLLKDMQEPGSSRSLVSAYLLDFYHNGKYTHLSRLPAHFRHRHTHRPLAPPASLPSSAEQVPCAENPSPQFRTE